MGHNHHHHVHASDLRGRNLLISILLNLLITVAQVIGGLISGSLSLISDALHNLSDVVSLVISYVATIFSKKSASLKRTFGYKRAEILAAFVNSATLVIVAVILIIEAIKRFSAPIEIESNIVIWLSLLGILANGLSVLILRKDAKVNMNMRSAHLHLFTDMLASFAVLIGGLLMKYFSMFWVDSVLTLIIAIYLIYVGYELLKQSYKVLMLFTPDEIQIQSIVKEVQVLDMVKSIHHIHVWQLNEDETHLEAHVEFHRNISLSEFDDILQNIEQILHDKFQINHINIQPEYARKDPKDIIVQD